MDSRIVFNKPYFTGKEIEYISKVHDQGVLSGYGSFTQLCSNWLEKATGCEKALLTHSCTAALEMAAILIDVKPGDEIIMPSYTFVSTANAFVMRGGIPVFVDIRPDTLNIDENKIKDAITSKTKAIVPVHYGGVGCDMDTIMEIANDHHLMVIEDAAQGMLANYKGRPLGSMGDLGCYSFHETKNITSGEGGALLINNSSLVERAEIICEKGTNRSQFYRGQVDKYSWLDIGSSYLPSESTAAFLWAQLEEADSIIKQRLKIWENYHHSFSSLESMEKIRRPIIPAECTNNGHIYYLLMKNHKSRESFIKKMESFGVSCVFHYVPLHTSAAGKRYGIVPGSMKITEDLSERLIRLPVWIGLDVERVIESTTKSC